MGAARDGEALDTRERSWAVCVTCLGGIIRWSQRHWLPGRHRGQVWATRAVSGPFALAQCCAGVEDAISDEVREALKRKRAKIPPRCLSREASEN